MVWREAFHGDFVCVPPQTREATREENALAAQRTQPNPYGPDGCRTGSVWREAFPGDRICVSPEARNRVHAENAAAPGRTGVLRSGPNGPRSCLAGSVWREAGPNDFVCVSPDARTLARRENAEAATHRGSDVCLSGYVWREAGPGDLVCVPPESRERARADNEIAWARRADPACDAYARRALEQYEAVTAYRLSGCYEEGRQWHGSYDNHFDWCLRAAPAARAEELKARDQGLTRCAAPTPSSGNCLWTVVMRSTSCLNVDGTPQQIAPGGTLSVAGCASTEEGALLRAKLMFGIQQCFTEGDDPLPGCCAFETEKYRGCGC